MPVPALAALAAAARNASAFAATSAAGSRSSQATATASPGNRDSGFSRPAGEADKAGLRWFTELLGKLSAQLNPKNKESSKART